MSREKSSILSFKQAMPDEEKSAIPENLLLKLQREWLVLSLLTLGLIMIIIGGFNLFKQEDQTLTIESIEGTSQTSDKIKVDIEGEVAKPGVYELNADSRFQDLLILAGGLAGEADRNWVAKNLNLAVKLNDGSKFYIPKTGEAASAQLSSSGDVREGEKININTASSQELDTLPGIGPATAQKIISNRPYQMVEELKDKKVVSASVFEKIKDQIVVW